MKNDNAPTKGWIVFIYGLCMGTADLIPGISGGTIAFLMGFYHPLMESIKSLNFSTLKQLIKHEGCQIKWKFLFPLLAGIGCAFFCFANLLQSILKHEDYRVYLYASFFGLIMASFVYCFKQIQKWNSTLILALIGGSLSAFLLTETTLSNNSVGHYAVSIKIQSEKPLLNYDAKSASLTGLTAQNLQSLLEKGAVTENTPVFDAQFAPLGFVKDFHASNKMPVLNIWLVMCGSLAVCALLLPGISGSYILILLGVYPLVLEALIDFSQGLKELSFHGEAFRVLGSMGVGILLGAALFSRLISWLLKYYPNFTLAILSGFMIGAIRSVWPFWSTAYMIIPEKIYHGAQLVLLKPILPSLHSSSLWLAALCTLCGFLVVLILEHAQHKRIFYEANP